ncbi:hypothetical protein M3Y99_00981500 [Aphelenchoides fujianensis]|nr:hypothetical protein M3Y99_00981500 [Aphelenchoides fujianensis]
MEGASKNDEFVVDLTHHFGANGKGKQQRVFKWRHGLLIDDLFNRSSPAYSCNPADYSSVRVLDGHSKAELSSDLPLEKGNVYRIETKQKTYSIRLKVNNEPVKQLDVPRSFAVYDLPTGRPVGAWSTAKWRPVYGYLPMHNRSKLVEDGASYWIKTCDYPGILFGDWVSGGLRRLVSKLPIGKREKKQPDVEEQLDGEERTAKLKSKIPTGCSCCLLTFSLIIALCLMIFFVGLNLQPTTTDAVVNAASTAKIPPRGHEVHEHPNRFAATTAAPASSNHDDGVLAALKVLSSKFDAERAERSKQMTEQQLKFDAQQSAMLEISKQLNDRQSKSFGS